MKSISESSFCKRENINIEFQKERVIDLHKNWKKRLKKMFGSGNFYRMFFVGTTFIGIALHGATIPVFVGLLDLSWTTTVISTMVLGAGATLSILMLEEMYAKNSLYDRPIEVEEAKKADEEKRKAEQKKTERYMHLKEFERSLSGFSKLEEHDNIARLLLKFEALIQELISSDEINSKERYYLETTLPKDLVNTMNLFRKLTPTNQNEDRM